jgi:hypothetical protein
MAKCLVCGKKIPDYYVPQLCDFCLGANMLAFFEQGSGPVPFGKESQVEKVEDFPGAITHEEVANQNLPVIVPKSKREITSALKKSNEAPDITLEKIKEWIDRPAFWSDLRDILYHNSMFLVNGSIYFDMYPSSKVGVGHILNKLKESKSWPKIKWYNLREN